MVSASRLTPPVHPVAILTGTTASGKTAIALEFARAHPGEIEVINADSLLVFRGFNLGTAKPTPEELAEIPHHLVDICEPDASFTAGDFVRECDLAIHSIHSRGKRALITGGTGFYLKALLFGLWDAPKGTVEQRTKLEKSSSQELFERLLSRDEKAAKRISVGDRYRLLRAWEMIDATGKTPSEFEAEASLRGSVPGLSLFVTDRQPEDLRLRIAKRTDQILASGFLEEVRGLREKFPNAKPLGSVGYVEAIRFLDAIEPVGRKVLPGIEGLKCEIQLATQQLAKRQRTFFGNENQGQFAKASHLKFFTLDEERVTLWNALKSLYNSSHLPS